MNASVRLNVVMASVRHARLESHVAGSSGFHEVSQSDPLRAGGCAGCAAGAAVVLLMPGSFLDG